jgi:hypothetical protein
MCHTIVDEVMWRTLIDIARGTIDVHGLRDGHEHLDPLLDRIRSTAIDFGCLAGCGRRLLSDAEAVGSHPTPSGRTGSVRRVECLSVLFGELFCFGAQRGCEVGELVEGRVLSHKSECGFDDLEVQASDIGQDAAHPSGGVIPALARRARRVVAALDGHENRGLACETEGTEGLKRGSA